MTKLHSSVICAALASILLPHAARAQTAGVTTSTDGTVSSSVRVPGLPAMGVQAGNGKVAISGPHQQSGTWRCTGANGKQITIRSADGTAVSSASASGNGTVVVAGSGPPGSRAALRDCKAVNPPRKK